MLTMLRALLAVLMIGLMLSALAESPQNQPQTHKTETTKQERGTEQNPVFVKTIPTDESEASAKQDEADRATQRAIDEETIKATEKIKDFTGALVIVGIIQALIFIGQGVIFWLQSGHLRRGIESNERIERPYVFVSGIKLERKDKTGIGGPIKPNDWTFKIKWKNVGRTPARITKLELILCPLADVPKIPDYGNPLPTNFVWILAANKSFVSPGPGPSESIATKDGKPVIFAVYGRITYSDLAGNECHTGFGVECSPYMNAFSTLKNKAYTYFD